MVIFSRVLSYWRYLGYVAIIAIALTTTTDVIGRYLFNQPLPGGMELIEQYMVCVVFLMLPLVTWDEKHIKVDFIANYFAGKVPRLMLIVSLVFELIILVVLVVFAWQGFVTSALYMHIGEETEVIGVKLYPFQLVMSVGFSLASIAFLILFIHHLSGLSAKMRRHV